MNDPRRQEDIASLFHVSDSAKECPKRQRPLPASSSSGSGIRYVATRSRSSRFWNVRDRDKVGSEENKEQQEREAQKNDHMALLLVGARSCLKFGPGFEPRPSTLGDSGKNGDLLQEHANQSKH
jgi:hypothetical protein